MTKAENIIQDIFMAVRNLLEEIAGACNDAASAKREEMEREEMEREEEEAGQDDI